MKSVDKTECEGLSSFLPATVVSGICADVMELVDVLDSKSGEGNLVWVRLPPSAKATSYPLGWLVAFKIGGVEHDSLH